MAEGKNRDDVLISSDLSGKGLIEQCAYTTVKNPKIPTERSRTAIQQLCHQW